MKKQARNNKRIANEINRKSKELNLAQTKFEHGAVIEEKLKYDLTDDEIA